MLAKHVRFKIAAMILALVLSILACDLPPPPIYDVYVSLAGNDTYDCRSLPRACRTVAAAMGKAANGGAIIIAAGRYSGSFLVNRFVTLRGAGQTQTVLTRPDNRGPVVGIAEYITGTLNNLTVTGGYQNIELRGTHSQLYGTDLSITNGQIGIENSIGGRVNLTNVTISGNAFGIVNGGPFRASHLTVQGNTGDGLDNFGVMDLDNAVVQQNGSTTADPQSSAAIRNTVQGARVGQITIKIGTIASNNLSGIFNLGGTVSISNVSVNNNRGTGVSNISGAMTLDEAVVRANGQLGVDTGASGDGSLQIARVAIIQNGQWGLYIRSGTATVVDATVSGNRSGGIVVSGGTLDLAYSTVAANSGGGLSKHEAASATLHNSIVALNAPLPNCVAYGAAITIDGTALACNDAVTAAMLRLGPLGVQAGTYVMPLQTGSPAIDAATGACPSLDQRGYGRPYGRACDVGAFEFGSSMALVAATPGIETPTATLGIIELLPSETPTPGVIVFLLDKNANCRHGPGNVYSVLTSLTAGQSAQVIGRNEDGAWLYTMIPGDYRCWMLATSGKADGDVMQVPVETAPPTPTLTPEPGGGGGGSDYDSDGYMAGKDCDDKNAKIHPGADETAKDGVDSNCNGKDDS